MMSEDLERLLERMTTDEKRTLVKALVDMLPMDRLEELETVLRGWTNA